MTRFVLRLRLDTPLLLCGAQAGQYDSSGTLRGGSLRGLLHTWARALIGPLVESKPDITRKAEIALLGSAGDDRGGGGQTFRIVDVTGASAPFCDSFDSVSKMSEEEFFLLPHKGLRNGKDERSPRYGFSPEQERVLHLSLRTSAVRADPGLPKALWAVAWTAFAFGSLGNRARRGFGSLTLVKAEGVPCVDSGVQLPVFPEDISREGLTLRLELGLRAAQAMVWDWLKSRNEKPLPLDDIDSGFVPNATRHAFFQLASMKQVRIGAKECGSGAVESIMKALMNECHSQSRKSAYRSALGNHIERLASPLWIRVYRVARNCHVPVATYSPREETSGDVKEMVNAILGSLNASHFC